MTRVAPGLLLLTLSIDTMEKVGILIRTTKRHQTSHSAVWPVDDEVMMFSVSVTEDMALSAALRTSCEHPGFTMLFTCTTEQNRLGMAKAKLVSQLRPRVSLKQKCVAGASELPSPDMDTPWANFTFPVLDQKSIQPAGATSVLAKQAASPDQHSLPTK
uniref:Uncharacterized protein n=1 Tax=Zea mays TaxID=4577 RepID=A0A804NVA0_MAIZE